MVDSNPTITFNDIQCVLTSAQALKAVAIADINI